MSGFHGISKAHLLQYRKMGYAGNLRQGFTPRVFHGITIDKRGKDAARGCFCMFRPAATSKDSGFSSVQG